jgi:CheY-like chemotaxis protein
MIQLERTNPDEHILVVDDESVVRRYVSRILREEGYEVHEVDNGGAAVEFLERSADPVDLVVSDVVMPGLNGVQLLERVSRTHPNLPCILMSGYATKQLTDLGIAAPCAVLGKPFSPEQLLGEVRRCLPVRR